MRIQYKSYSDLCRDIANNFDKFSGDWDLVVGIPRSGMIPAYMIALALNVNCTDIASWVSNYPLKRGITRKVRKDISMPWEAKKVLIVDDSIMSGESMKKEVDALPSWLSSLASTLAVYSSKPVRNDVDIVLEYVPCPRVFEWNVFHHGVVARSCVSLEGMMHERRPRDDDFIRRFRYVPSGVIDTIISCRTESSRNEVAACLKSAGVSYRHLVMVNDSPNLMTMEDLVRFKIEAFKASSSELFIERSAGHSRLICRGAGKPVLCLNESVMYNPGSFFGARSIKNGVRRLVWKFSGTKF